MISNAPPDKASGDRAALRRRQRRRRRRRRRRGPLLAPSAPDRRSPGTQGPRGGPPFVLRAGPSYCPPVLLLGISDALRPLR
ncbi:hypothetical protein ACHAWF_009960, partial [Thalassiosira exigua]